jgi:hypothetical protein
MSSDNTKYKEIHQMREKDKENYYNSVWKGSIPPDLQFLFDKVFNFIPAPSFGGYKYARTIRTKEQLTVRDFKLMCNAILTLIPQTGIDNSPFEEKFYYEIVDQTEMAAIEWNIAEDKFLSSLRKLHLKRLELANLTPLQQDYV